MEGRLGFLTKARRELPNYNENPIGPGEYSTLHDSNSKPNFAPFCTTSKRELSVPQSSTPSPGTYQVGEDSTKVKSLAAGTIFKSKAKRFVPEKPQIGPGPGTYVLQSAIQVKKPMRRSRSQPSHLDALRNLSTQASAPSIPTKFQSFGYEETEDGNLRLQEPIRPGFSGLKNDHVGPGDYDPKIVDSLHPRAPSSLFHKGAPRVVGEKPSDIPGPGYYNYKSTFEFPDDGGNEGNFYLRFNQASTRQLSSFESTTQRPSILGKKVDPNEPGPGTYNIPRNGVEVKKSEAKIQCFDSTVDRFQNPMPRSQRIKTHPGSYNPLVSDFEKNRIDILKKKRMLARSGWAQNISFESTEERFHNNGAKSVAPPPGTYTPKTALVDHLPKENPRSGAFGSTLKRFYNPPNTIQSPNLQSEEIENGFSAYNETRDGIGSRERVLSRSRSPPSKPTKPSRPFANNEERFSGKKDITNAPPPGTYDKPPSWKTSGVLKIKEHKTKSLPRPEIHVPGPGEYNVGTNLLHKGKANPHFIMGGSNERFRHAPKAVSPGPGDYDPTPFIGTLNRPTYNSIMADEAATKI